MPTIACPDCSTNNRVPDARLSDNPKCGRCGAPLFQGKPMTLTAANFDRHIGAELPLLVDFWAEWCGPCKMIAPILDELSDEYADRLKICKMDIDANQQTPPKFGIRGIPTLMLFKNGELEATKVGALSKSQLSAFIDSNI